MDSTLISTPSVEETPSLNRARRAALGSFAGAVVDWYRFSALWHYRRTGL